MKICLRVIRKIQNKTTMRYHYTTLRMAEIKNKTKKDNTKCWPECRAPRTYYTVMVGMAITLENGLVLSYKVKYTYTYYLTQQSYSYVLPKRNKNLRSKTCI